ncbi:MAG: DUF4339 domain-containing protein [Tildeniella nuda ZEHNDER 1965/U140]|jgi:hypothetical protein|nr:DUF4339 domain-containing protein [Tildeniella nuda ZEHNDER 1965/U140]
MTPQEVLTAARQGNPQAIAALINRSLKPQQLVAKVRLADGYLHVMVEGATVPEQRAIVPFIVKGVQGLGVANVSSLVVYGKLTGEDVPAWSDRVELARIQVSEVSQLKVFRVKQSDKEIEVPDIETLRQWLRDGSVKPSDYIYNPTLDQWMYVKDLAELSSDLKKQGSTQQADQYNRMGFIFGGLGVLMLLVFPPAGIILIILGVVFAAMYYTKK